MRYVNNEPVTVYGDFLQPLYKTQKALKMSEFQMKI